MPRAVAKYSVLIAAVQVLLFELLLGVASRYAVVPKGTY